MTSKYYTSLQFKKSTNHFQLIYQFPFIVLKTIVCFKIIIKIKHNLCYLIFIIIISQNFGLCLITYTKFITTVFTIQLLFFYNIE